MDDISCPMCGKYGPANSFHISDKDDIFVISRRSLGRKKGFEETERMSIFDSDYEDQVSAINERAFEIIKIFRDNGKISDDDILEQLGFDSSEEEEDEEE